jgi:DNA-binding NtrC family response regulator
MMSRTTQGGRCILVVEDDVMIAMLLETVLAEAGYGIVGPAGRLDTALSAAREGIFDAALLDVNLAGEAVVPVADILTERNLPFAFVTGYDTGALPPQHRHRPFLRKPYRAQAVLAMLSLLIGPAI